MRQSPRSTTAILALSTWALMGLSCQGERPDPPSAVEVPTAVQVPCQIAEPQCKAPAYNAARKDWPADKKAKFLRVEIVDYEDCLRRYREALAACRAPSGGATP